ncbi:MAG: hypothetical protein VX077_07550 [Pseudomonadota bacterium]|nr:hypothetical protein [Pseudomonadota bacterium]
MAYKTNGGVKIIDETANTAENAAHNANQTISRNGKSKLKSQESLRFSKSKKWQEFDSFAPRGRPWRRCGIAAIRLQGSGAG